MNLLKKFATCVLFIGVLINLSCQKEIACENCGTTPPASTNKSPFAKAGPDQTIQLPSDSATLDGSSSNDQDGTISAYLWTKISGPVSFNINRPYDSISKVKTLTAGVYLFELKVTDNGGLTSKDTVRIFVINSTITNLPPIANAGNDTTINYDLQTCNSGIVTVILNGSASTDPDGTIVSYLWTGPGTIANPISAITTVTNLSEGISVFILKVIDNNGDESKDTVQINMIGTGRPLVPVTLTPIRTVATSHNYGSIGTAGNKVVFAGGYDGNESTSGVDIYDLVTNSWSTAQLSKKRHGMAVATCGSKIFFGGGYYDDGNIHYLCKDIDIYDASSNTWTIDSLSYETSGLVAVSVGNRVLFAGGTTSNYMLNFYDNVDIYDLTTNSWSTATLSEARGYLSAVAINNKVYLAGGFKNGGSASNKIDIYDNATSSWSTGTLNEAKGCLAGIAINNKIYWAGGIIGTSPFQLSNQVEIWDVNNQNVSLNCLAQRESWFLEQPVAVKDNKLVLFPNNSDGVNGFQALNIYDFINNTWSTGVLNQQLSGASIISVNNTIYVAGGTLNGNYYYQVWKLEF